MKNFLHPDWQHCLQEEFEKSYFIDLTNFIEKEYEVKSDKIFPSKKQVFRAFDVCNLDQLKVVIIGQDPYPTRGHANGLCFSINPDVQPFAKSLINIFKEIENDLQIKIPENGDLSRWANQGVLMLNAILTVEEGLPQSHKNKGWEKFTDAVIAKISQEKNGVVFLLWGGYAIKKGKSIDRTKHLVLESGHPSPLSANQGKWFGNKHFSKTNDFLIQNNSTPIQW